MSGVLWYCPSYSYIQLCPAPVVPLDLYVYLTKLAFPWPWGIISVVWLEIGPPFMIAPNAEAISLMLLFGELAPPSTNFSKVILVLIRMNG